MLPEGTRLVHVGPPKTGTTAIQRALHARRDDLRERGIDFPGRGMRPRAAGWAVVGMGTPRGRAKPTMAAWQELVDEVAAAGDHRVVVSNESFADGDADAVKTIVDGLGGERVHVVHTVRRVDKLLNSHWQQRVRAGLTVPYDDWLRIVLGEPNPEDAHWRGFWRHHDLSDVLDRWVTAAGSANVTLIIADENDYELLPRLFERFLGLPEGFLPLDADRSNRSLSLNEIEMLRHLHTYSAERGWSDELFRHVLRFGVVDDLMTMPRNPGDQRIDLPVWAAERAAEINAERVETVRSLGVRVVGDPERLHSSASEVEPTDVGDLRVSTEVAARVTAAAISAGERRFEDARKTAERRTEEARAASKVEDELAALRRRMASVRRVDDLTTRELAAELRTRIKRRLRRRR